MTLASKARRLSCLALTVAATAAAGLATSAPASAVGARPATAHPAAANAVAAYAWVDGAIDTYYAFNSKVSGSQAVLYSSSASGLYEIEFAQLGSIASNVGVQVTTYSQTVTCAVTGWSKDGGKLKVGVNCYNLSGSLVAGDFDIIVTHPTSAPHGVFDYALDDHPNSSGPLTSNQYNSSRKQNSAKHLGTGRYQVLFGGPKTSGTQGVVHVTAFGGQPGSCEVESWTGSAQGELVNVDCFGPGPNPVPQNRGFTVAYATSSSLMGINSQVVANAFANSKAPLYSPTVQFDSKKGAKVSVVHYGEYEVLAVGSGGNFSKWGGDVQVSAVGNKDKLCISDGWGQELTPSLDVDCYDKAGHLVDASFTVEWVVP